MTSEDKFRQNIYYRMNANGRPKAISLDLAKILINDFGWTLGKNKFRNINRIFKESKANNL